MNSYRKVRKSDQIVDSILKITNGHVYFRILVRKAKSGADTFALLYTPQCLGGIILLVDVPLMEIREALGRIKENGGPFGLPMGQMFFYATEVASILALGHKAHLECLTNEEFVEWRKHALDAIEGTINSREPIPGPEEYIK